MTRVRGALLRLLACLVAVVSAGCGGSPEPDSARGRVEALQRALVESDGAALVRLAEDPRYSVSTALLTDPVLGQGALADQDVDIETTHRGLESTRYALRVPDDEPTPWLEPELRRSGSFAGLPLPSVTLDGPGVSAVRIGGESVRIDPLPSNGKAFYLPPGEYDIGAGGAERYVDHGPMQHFDTRDRDARGVRFTGELTAAGRTRIDQAVQAFVSRCTDLVRGSRPANCPARSAFIGGLASSEWTLDSYPRIAVKPNGDGWLVSTPEPPVARMRGILKHPQAGESAQVRDTVPFADDGTITVRGDHLVIDIPGY